MANTKKQIRSFETVEKGAETNRPAPPTAHLSELVNNKQPDHKSIGEKSENG